VEPVLDSVVSAIIKLVTEGSREAIMALGWLLFVIERYHVTPRREKEFREEVAEFRENYQSLADKLSATLSNFSNILEIVKDRIGRSS
jgi:hypothetical protein